MYQRSGVLVPACWEQGILSLSRRHRCTHRTKMEGQGKPSRFPLKIRRMGNIGAGLSNTAN